MESSVSYEHEKTVQQRCEHLNLHFGQPQALREQDYIIKNDCYCNLVTLYIDHNLKCSLSFRLKYPNEVTKLI